MPGKNRARGGKAVHVISLGCPKNLVDTERFLALMTRRGYRLAEEPEEADILFVNTCAFLSEAVDESRAFIRELEAVKRRRPEKKLYIAGCLVGRFGAALAGEHPAADRFIAPGELDSLPHRHLCTPGYYGYLKISEGCDNRCAYCLIPSLRGPLRSRPPEEIIAEARALAAGGVRELNIIAQDTTAYGRDTGGTNLARLLEALCRQGGFRWLRLLYGYPGGYDREMINLLAKQTLFATPGGVICPYLDVPFQHGSDRILAAMNRRGTAREGLALVRKLRSAIPRLALRTTFIVGFPGETDDDFARLKDFAREAAFEKIGIFTFSPEEGTPAATMPGQVPGPVRQERFAELAALAGEISRRKLAASVGEEIDVLVEGPNPENSGGARGRTCFDAPEVDGAVHLDRPAPAGTFARARITGFHDCDLAGTVITPRRAEGGKRRSGAAAPPGREKGAT